ncbi:MAG: OmpA family protein [Verrucomicrobia bacterium]|nr:OmpA family protein [Cytophagales bacterium]
MRITFKFSSYLLVIMLAAACSPSSKEKSEATDTTQTVKAEPVIEKKPETVTTETSTATAEGFDSATLPVSSQTLGAFPYVSLIDGYEKMTKQNMGGNSSIERVKDVAFDQYEFFDGSKLIAIEGRLSTIHAMGKGASAFQVFKTYESLITGLGGVKVWQGKGIAMIDKKIKYEDPRHRAKYNMLNEEQMGIYVVKTADKEVWLEAYKAYGDEENYWLTVMERKALPMKASVLPAEQMKKELDANGHVALYINFDTDKASIKPESQAAVEQVVKLLKANPDLKLTVEGHTDNAGKPDYNLKLSDNRAKAVVATLTTQGIENNRLKAIGLGQTKPIADNTTEEGKSKNRRVELVRMP